MYEITKINTIIFIHMHLLIVRRSPINIAVSNACAIITTIMYLISKVGFPFKNIRIWLKFVCRIWKKLFIELSYHILYIVYFNYLSAIISSLNNKKTGVSLFFYDENIIIYLLLNSAFVFIIHITNTFKTDYVLIFRGAN